MEDETMGDFSERFSRDSAFRSEENAENGQGQGDPLPTFSNND